MNPYTKNINRIEFVMTYACTGKCKHCSVGEDLNRNERINGDIASEMIKKVSNEFKIKTLMTFGGEPLLCINEVCQIHKTAYFQIPCRNSHMPPAHYTPYAAFEITNECCPAKARFWQPPQT